MFASNKETKKYTVIGAKCFKGDVEGTSYDSTTIYAVLPMHSNDETSKGFNTVPFKVGKSDVFHQIKHLPFPFDAEFVVEQTTGGKGEQKTVVHQFKPLGVTGAGGAKGPQ